MLRALSLEGFDVDKYQGIRTEDIKFSPSGKCFAIVSKGIIILCRVEFNCGVARILETIELYSEGLQFSHGIDFVREDILVVANREGWVNFFQIPDQSLWTDQMTIPVLYEHECPWFGPKGKVRTSFGRSVRCGPGAVRLSGDRLFVSTNHENTVTAHNYKITETGIEVSSDLLVAQDGLEIPDGLTISRNGQYLAVSNLHFCKVMIYDVVTMSLMCELTDPDLGCPHGVCFDKSGSVIFVADAGNKYVHEFQTFDGWKTSIFKSSYKIQAVDQAAFDLTKSETPEAFRYLEGGIKGIDVHPTLNVVCVTCRHQPLKIFEIISNHNGVTASPGSRQINEPILTGHFNASR